MRRREFISAAALLPLAARAQPSSKVYQLGYLAGVRVPRPIEALQAGLRELGYVKGKNRSLRMVRIMPKRRPSHSGSPENNPGAAVIAFDQSRRSSRGVCGVSVR